MAYRNLLDFVQRLRQEGEFQEIGSPISLDGDMAIMAQRIGQRKGPALYFHHPQNHEIPVLFNLFGSERRMALALGGEPKTIAERLNSASSPTSTQGSFWNRAAALLQNEQFDCFSPKRAEAARCKEIVLPDASADFGALPIPIAWNDEGRPSITLGQVHCVDCDTGRPNAGIYRVSVVGNQQAEIHWRSGKGAAEVFRGYMQANRRMPIAIVLGDDPIISFAAYAPTPPGVDELRFAGILRGAPVEMIPCETIQLEVPAQAEIVLEGYVDPMDFGPSAGVSRPLFHLTCISRARDAVYPSTAWGGPSPELAYFRQVADRVLLPLLRQTHPEILDIIRPVESGAENLAIVSIEKAYAGQAYKVAHGLWGTGLFSFCRMIIVVDAEIDVSRYDEVFWRTLNRFDPERGAQLVSGPVDTPGQDSALPRFGAKMVIDATRPFPGEPNYDESDSDLLLSMEALNKADQLIREMGIDTGVEDTGSYRLSSIPESVL